MMKLRTMAKALAILRELRQEYVQKRAIFIPSRTMREVLPSLGADISDLTDLVAASENLLSDPTLVFRKSQSGRFSYDSETREVTRLKTQPFILSAQEGFVRHDSGAVRQFSDIQPEVQSNSVALALFAFKYIIVEDVDVDQRPHLEYDSSTWITTLFHLRTTTTTDLLGEPALEGVHSDGADHTMTTLLDARNMTSDSAVTFTHDMRQADAAPWNETDPELIRGHWQHRHALDTLLIVDHELKHSLSPLKALDPSEDATRDMLVFFTRRPTTHDHVSCAYDSTEAHHTMPMTFALPSG